MQAQIKNLTVATLQNLATKKTANASSTVTSLNSKFLTPPITPSETIAIYGSDFNAVLKRFDASRQLLVSRNLMLCYFGKVPTLEMVSRVYGAACAKLWIELQLNDLAEFFGCREKFSESQRSGLATMIMYKYARYRLTEIMLFMHYFKDGRYGKFFSSVDSHTLLSGMAEFNRKERSVMLGRREAAMEQQRRADEDGAYEAVRRRYEERVPGAYSEEAPMTFIQYQLLGYDDYTDSALAAECRAIRAGVEELPKEIEEILEERRERGLVMRRVE